jgi:hypothetical protein
MIRRIALFALVAPYCIWYWPQWSFADFVASYRAARRRP